MKHQRLHEKRVHPSGSIVQTIDVVECEGRPVVLKSTHVTVSQSATNAALRELDILLLLRETENEDNVQCGSQSPPVVRYVQHRLTGTTLQVYEEYCPRGDLHAVLSNELRLRKAGLLGDHEGFVRTEHQLSHVFRGIAQGVAYMHARGIAHMDLSLENIFMTEEHHVRLGDFEHAIRFERGSNGVSHHQSVTGISKAVYAAPEVHHAVTAMVPINVEQADVWSLGIVLYMLWTKTSFVTQATRKDPTFCQVQDHGPLRALLATKHLTHSSHRLCDLLARCLDPVPETRITMKQVLAHSWLTEAPPLSPKWQAVEPQKCDAIDTARLSSEIALDATRVVLRSTVFA